MIIYVSLLVALIGLLMYILSSNAKIVNLGLIRLRCRSARLSHAGGRSALRSLDALKR